jgi:outer membrane immunogenic protein
MKRLILASVTFLALTGIDAALAGDVPPAVIYPAGTPPGVVYRAAPPGVVYPAPAPNFTFTGYYVGGTVGGALASLNYTETPSGAFGGAVPFIAGVGASSLAPRGVIGGIEAGYNWQVGHFVLGFEGDFSGWDLSASTGVTLRFPTPSSTTSISSNWLFTARPRIGFANGNQLLYLTGGLAVSNISFSQSILLSPAGPTLAGAASSTQVGWTAGGGIEYALSWNWLIKAEYLYVSFANQSTSQVVAGAPAFTGTATGNLTASIARAGFDYRF